MVTPSFVKRQLPLFFFVILVILGIRSSIIEPFRIPTRSMLPTLFMGDFLFANKLKYGLRVPFSEVFGDRPIYIAKGRAPKRGEIVVFTPPELGQENLYIKRVIGLPGDKIKFQGKKIILNGKHLTRIEILGKERDEVFSNRGFDPEERYQKEKLHLFKETIDQHSFFTIEDDSYEGIKSEAETIIPEDHFFVLGDNRDDTRDSRNFGVISLHSIHGQAFVVWLSYRISLSDSHWSFRTNRIGMQIQ